MLELTLKLHPEDEFKAKDEVGFFCVFMSASAGFKFFFGARGDLGNEKGVRRRKDIKL